MRDISHKSTTLRTATARAILIAAPKTIGHLRAGEIPKGDPLPVAKVAAVQAVTRFWDCCIPQLWSVIAPSG